MKDYYKFLEINSKSSLNDIKDAYKNSIHRFIGLPYLTNKMKGEIKEFKTALYILGNKKRRAKYDNLNKINNNINYNKFSEYDELLNDENYKKKIEENNKITDRLFDNLYK